MLLVGDVHQLPSVGAGDVFRQLILCGKIPVTVLNLVYRQGKDSNIPINAQLINEGKTNLQWGMISRWSNVQEQMRRHKLLKISISRKFRCMVWSKYRYSLHIK